MGVSGPRWQWRQMEQPVWVWEGHRRPAFRVGAQEQTRGISFVLADERLRGQGRERRGGGDGGVENRYMNKKRAGGRDKRERDKCHSLVDERVAQTLSWPSIIDAAPAIFSAECVSLFKLSAPECKGVTRMCMSSIRTTVVSVFLPPVQIKPEKKNQ